MRNKKIPSNKDEHEKKSEHYFNKVVTNMNNKDFIKFKMIHKTEFSIEFNDFDERLLKRPTTNDEFEEYSNNKDSLFWLEFLENKELYSALKNLRIQDLIILDLWIRQGYSQKEIAEIFDLTENAIKSRIHRIKLKIRRNFKQK